VGPMAEQEAPELANVGLIRGEAVERGEREGVGAGVGDSGPADKGGEVLVGGDEVGDRGGQPCSEWSSARGRGEG
jgi:hypothetical protein